MVVDTGGLEALVAEVAAEDSYGFDTEFHTERTYVPDLALIQIAWADKVALVDPLAVDPAPLATVFGGPGIAVAHAASQDLDVLMAACGAVPATVFDTQIVAGFLGHVHPLAVPPGRPDARRLAAQGGPALGLARPADLGPPGHLRPQRRRPPLELRDVLTERLRALGRLEWALNECDQVLGDRTPARVPEEAWWKLGDIRGMSRRSRAVAQEVAAWRERTAAETNRPRRMVLSDLGLLAISQRPPRNGDELRATRGVDGRHLAQGRAAEILRAVERGLALPSDQIRMPSEGRDAPAPAGRGRRVLGCGAPDRRRPRLRPGPPRHAGRHRAAALRRAEPARYGLAPHHRRGPAAPPDRRRGRGRLRPARAPRHGGALRPAGSPTSPTGLS